jgi:hypothetical protein
MGGRCYIYRKKLPLSDNIELYALLFKAGALRECSFLYEEITHEELEILVDNLGVDILLEQYRQPKMVERIKEIANPLVKSAAKMT